MKKLKVLSLAILLMVGVMCFSACQFGGLKTYVIESDAMAPALKEGDIVTVKEASDYEAGDIIAFKYSHGLTVIHRLVYVYSELDESTESYDTYYICHGDNTQSVNPYSNTLIADWEDDNAYIQGLVDDGATLEDLIDSCYNVQIVEKDDIIGKVTNVLSDEE